MDRLGRRAAERPWLYRAGTGRRRRPDVWDAVRTIAEIRRGVLEKPVGKKRDQLERWFSGPDGPQALFAGRILPFDEKSALVWARLMAEGKSRGRPRDAIDMMIA